MEKLCKIENCSKPVRCKDLCTRHYAKSRPNVVAYQKEYLKKYTKSDSFRRSVGKDHRKPRRRFNMGRRSAGYRGLAWMLTFEQWSALVLNAVCHYCGGSLPETGVALDRVDNAKGYELGNVVPCCKDCNHVKGSRFTYEEAKAMIEALVSYRKKAS